jgi:hypothetical protein
MKRVLILSTLALGLTLVCSLGGAQVYAATRTVDTTADNAGLTGCTGSAGDCSLRGAISNAVVGDTINFDPSLNGQTITVSSLISIPRAMTIAGPGADKLTISGGNTTSIMEAIVVNGTITISGLTFANGNGAGGSNPGQGGAIEFNSVAATVIDRVVFRDNSAGVLGGVLLTFGGNTRISNSTFTNNTAPQASVIYEGFGPTQITNTTFTGNTETGGGSGAIYLRGNNIIRNCTFAGNTGRSNIYASSESVTLTIGNTILAGNTASDIFVGGSGSIVSNGGNLISRNNQAGATFSLAGSPNGNGDYVGTSASPLDAQLAPLGNYGGGTLTRPLLPTSFALDHGSNCVVTNTCAPAIFAALTTDQRGAPRQVGAAVDIGAFETNYTFAASSLPNGTAGLAYDELISATRQTSLAQPLKLNRENLVPLIYETIPAAGPTGLPPGLTLEASGQLHGVPTTPGSFTFTVKVTDQADGISGVFQFTVAISSPTAAGGTVSGRVLGLSGGGLANTPVILTDTRGVSRLAVTNPFGYFYFDEVEAGGIIVVSVGSKRYQYLPQVLNVNGDLIDVIFVPEIGPN